MADKPRSIIDEILELAADVPAEDWAKLSPPADLVLTPERARLVGLMALWIAECDAAAGPGDGCAADLFRERRENTPAWQWAARLAKEVEP